MSIKCEDYNFKEFHTKPSDKLQSEINFNILIRQEILHNTVGANPQNVS